MDSAFLPRKRRPKKQLRRGRSRARKRVSKMKRNARGQFVGRRSKATKTRRYARKRPHRGYSATGRAIKARLKRRRQRRRAARRHPAVRQMRARAYVNRIGRKIRKRALKRRRGGPSRATRQRLAIERTQHDTKQKSFNAARTAIAKRLGVTPGHADAHYQALIEHEGLSPEVAREQTWGFQP